MPPTPLVRLARGVAVCIAVLVFAGVPAGAAEIRMLASNAVKDAYSELVSAFEQSSGHTVTILWGGSADIVKGIRAGDVADIVLVPAASIDDLIAEGKLARGSRVDLVRSRIGVAVRLGAPRPDLSSGDALRRYLLASSSIVLSGGPSGVYLGGLFQRMGIADAIGSRLIRLAPGLSVGAVLARGEGEIGFTQVSEFLSIAGITYVGPLPADVQQVTVFSAGLHAAAPAPAAAKALLNYLTAPASAPVLKRSGLEPF